MGWCSVVIFVTLDLADAVAVRRLLSFRTAPRARPESAVIWAIRSGVARRAKPLLEHSPKTHRGRAEQLADMESENRCHPHDNCEHALNTGAAMAMVSAPGEIRTPNQILTRGTLVHRAAGARLIRLLTQPDQRISGRPLEDREISRVVLQGIFISS